MKSAYNILIAISLLVISQHAAAAGNIGSGKIIGIRVDASGMGVIVFNANMTTPAACINTTYYGNSMAFNANTAGGKGILAAALFAQGKNATVIAYGTGACGIYSGAIEDISLFYEAN